MGRVISTSILFFLLLSRVEAVAYCGKIAVETQVSGQIEAILKKNNIEVVGLKGNVHILKARYGRFESASGDIYNNLEKSKDVGRLTLRKIENSEAINKVQGLVVYIMDKTTQEILFVGVPDGCDASSTNALIAAELFLHSVPATRTSTSN